MRKKKGKTKRKNINLKHQSSTGDQLWNPINRSINGRENKIMKIKSIGIKLISRVYFAVDWIFERRGRKRNSSEIKFEMTNLENSEFIHFLTNSFGDAKSVVNSAAAFAEKGPFRKSAIKTHKWSFIGSNCSSPY